MPSEPKRTELRGPTDQARGFYSSGSRKKGLLRELLVFEETHRRGPIYRLNLPLSVQEDSHVTSTMPMILQLLRMMHLFTSQSQ